MTRKQVLVVTALAVVDLLIIAGLGIYAWAYRRPAMQPPILEAFTAPSDCVLFLLDSAERAGWTARVSETESVLLYEVSLGASSGSAADPQAIWTVLDSLSPEFAKQCGTPEMVTITAIVGAEGAGARQQVTAQFTGDALVPWLQGLTSDSDLAYRSRYRSSPVTAP